MPQTPSTPQGAAGNSAHSTKPEPTTSLSSPPKATVAGRMTFSQEKYEAERRRLDLCLELAGKFVGEYEASKFVDFLPKVKRRATPTIDFSEVPYGKGKETLMYDPFVKAIQDSGCCPSLVVHDTSTKGDASSNVKPDCGFFRTSIEESDAKAKCMSLVDIPVEFKAQATSDAFHSKMNDGKVVERERADANGELREDFETFQKATLISIKNRGQQIDYATLVMALQHRTHVFSISINGPKARLIRWDRAGACVSEAFDYILAGKDRETKTNWLAEFLFRYAHATPEQRGFDPNVKPANGTEVEQLEDAVSKYLADHPDYPEHLARELKHTVDPSYPAYKVTVANGTPSSKKKGKSNFIICRPFFESLSLCSRATRGYLAYWVEDKRLVFLKDTWRVDDPDTLSEAQVYEILQKHETIREYLPVVLAAGDVYGANRRTPLQTKTQDVTGCEWVPHPEWLRKHVCHRVVQELAIPLQMLQSSRQLLEAIRRTLIVIKVAYHEAKLLHRDISINNIMMRLDFAGILNDWDHAIRADDLTRKVHSYRTGTWQFMSIDILRNVNKPHTIHDEVESTFWVFYYAALHYFKISRYDGPGDEPSLDLFDQIKVKTGRDGRIMYVGGGEKNSTLRDGEIQQVYFESKPLTEALHQFADILQTYRNSAAEARGRKGNDSDRKKFATADQEIYTVDPIIQIFDDIFADKDLEWPEGNDAVKDQYPKESRLEIQTRLEVAHATTVTRSHKSVPNADSRPPTAGNAAGSNMPPPAFIPDRGATRSTSRKSAANAPPPVASGSGTPQAILRSTSSSKRPIEDGAAKADRESSDGRTKRSRQQKQKPIGRVRPEQEKYTLRPRRLTRSG